MVNECILIIEYEPPIPFTCAEATGIPKGTVLKLTDPMTVAIADGDADTVGGIAAEEKISGDGKTKISVYREGIFKGFAGNGGVVVGKAIVTDNGTSDDNELAVAGAADEEVLGIALETASSAESFLFELKIISWNP